MNGHYGLTRKAPKLCFIVVVCGTLYVLLGQTLSPLTALKRLPVGKARKEQSRTLYLLNNGNTKIEESPTGSVEDAACKFMSVDPYKKSILRLAGLEREELKCASPWPDLTYVKGARLEIDEQKVKNLTTFKSCRYRDIYRHPESDHRVTFGNWSKEFTSGFKLKDNTEFILVVCENNQSEIVAKTYHALVPRHTKLIELELLRQKKRQVESRPEETLNVIMVGMDGVSRHQMMRGMNKTYTFLMEELHSFDMTMYTQVGINTFPNFLPLLSGYTEDEVGKWWDRSKHMDPLDTIWRDYSNAGYRTLFTEDYPHIGGFHFAKQGFMFPPTTYYSHPIHVAMYGDKEIWRAGYHCAGNQAEVDFHFKYIHRFMDSFKDTPKFAFTFFTKLTHDDMTNNKRVEEHTYNFYKTLLEKGHLNNTLLITFSDHGPRWGAIRATVHGILESRAPYAVLSFPKWFLDKYPDVAQNVRTNANRLTTHFDVHATLQELLYFKASGSIPLVPRKHGISLFSKIPKSRTCQDVPIPVEFCLCNQETVEAMQTNSSVSVGLGDVVLTAVNGKRNTKLCTDLKMKNILEIFMIRLPSLGSNDKRLFKVKFQTVPGDAIYEGTVQTKRCVDKELIDYFDQLRAGNNSNPLEVTVGASIDRLTLYKGQADCEPDAAKKPYCYCRNLIGKEAKNKYNRGIKNISFSEKRKHGTKMR
ncbi:hypothetical protein Btru_047956 [Bulinus truncatus]|nr:hypothetical protein Btru_047956 [Bulinus truncatus]